MTEHQILNLMHEMTLVATAYKTHQHTDHQIAQILIYEFTGNLKGWWDNCVSSLDKIRILTVIKVEQSGIGIDQTQDVIATLIYTITKNFIGELVQFQERSFEILSNLTCPKLQDFKWYEDVFLSKIFTRMYYNNQYWKEKFLSGLPKLIVGKVRQTIRQIYQVTIPFHNLT